LAIAAFALVMLAALTVPGLKARAGAPAIAVFPPWWSAERTFAAASKAGVRIAGSPALPGTLTVVADDGLALVALYDAGALSLISTKRAGDCSLIDVQPRYRDERP
jgi:hypothetical protein